jgi:hypothetical protein
LRLHENIDARRNRRHGFRWQPQIDDLRGTGLLASTPQLQVDITREEQEIGKELDDYELWPILQVEFLYRF